MPPVAVGILVVVVVAAAIVVRQRARRRREAERERLRRFVAAIEDGAGDDGPGADATPGATTGADTMTDMTAAGNEVHSVVAPTDLPTFADVGGMDELKQSLADTVGLVLAHGERARDYQVAFNGLLLHGPPGTGKSHLARAIAGEYGMSLLHVSTGDLVEGVVGASARNVAAAFDAARAARPCVLFLDEFDSIAQRRDAAGHPEERRTVNQLLVALEAVQDDPGVFVVAATNDLDHLDPAVIRPGRFDRQVRVDMPDHDGRRAILEVQLGRRPSAEASVDLDAWAARTGGWSAADLAQLVEDAAMRAFRDAATTGDEVHVGPTHLEAAMAERGGRDRPLVEHWSWDDLVLPPDVLGELRQLEALLAEPELASRLGVEPPRGVLLTGPPGTGKTTVAKVLAAQARCSFYPVSAADVSSRWHGESERSIQRLFERARAHRPSIVFIDEIDAIGRTRGQTAGTGIGDRQLTQLLAEIDGIASSDGVLVVGATNRPDVLDPALRRGGRLSRTIELPLPDEALRLKLLTRMTARMPTVGVDLARVAAATDGLSGADLEALCQQAAIHALVRVRGAGEHDAAVEVLPEDVARAILEARA